MDDPDPARATAATEAMLRMRKIVVAELEAAADAAGGDDKHRPLLRAYVVSLFTSPWTPSGSCETTGTELDDEHAHPRRLCR